MPKYFRKYVAVSFLWIAYIIMKKTWEWIIIYIIYTLHNDKGMVCDGGKIKLEHLVLKPIRYQHHHLNFKESLENGLIPKGLKINKQPAIKPVKEEFFEK